MHGDGVNGQISSYYYTTADMVSIGRAMLCKDMQKEPESPDIPIIEA